MILVNKLYCAQRAQTSAKASKVTRNPYRKQITSHHQKLKINSSDW